MDAFAEYDRQKRYFASGLIGRPDTADEATFWVGWDRQWVRRRPGRRTAEAVAWIALIAALVKR